MTCIVGLVAYNKVYMGGDSAGICGWDLTSRADTKVFKNGSYLFGFTDSFRMGQLLRYEKDLPEPVNYSNISFDRFMHTVFIDAVRQCLRTGGWSLEENKRESGGAFLVGVHKRLFRVCSDFQIAESLKSYDAIGCGAPYALGAMFVDPINEPERRIKNALLASYEHCAGVRGPFEILSQ